MRSFAFLAIFIPFVACAQEISKPRLTVLDNGLRIITVEDHKSPLVSAVWSVHAGGNFEPSAQAGISHFLEHLVSGRGTKKYPGNQISATVVAQGGYVNAEAGHDSTIYKITLRSNSIDKILDMHEQMMFHTVIGGRGFELEKKVVFDEIRADADVPSNYLWDKAPYHMYPNQTFYSRSSNGTIGIVRSLTIDQVRNYYRKYYIPNNITLVVVGAFDTYALLKKISLRFNKYARVRPQKPLYSAVSIKPGVTVVSEERHTNRAYFFAGFEGPAARTADFVPFAVLMHYLGTWRHNGVLHETLVNRRKLLERISAYPMRRRFRGGWQPITGRGAHDKIVKGIDGLLTIFGRIRAKGISAESLELTKKRMINFRRRRMEDGLRYATALAAADANGDYRLASDFADLVRRVTPEDISTVARKYLGPDQFFVMGLFRKAKRLQTLPPI